ncbi:MAG: cell division protein FtsL [bacterium]|nr:cell division protein FtsL [bacterium]
MRFRRTASPKRKEIRSPETPGFVSRLLTLSVFAVMISIPVAVGFFYAQARLQALEIGYQIAEAEKQLKAVTRENERLGMEVAVLKSPERIGTLAGQSLGLVWPDPARIRVISAR